VRRLDDSGLMHRLIEAAFYAALGRVTEASRFRPWSVALPLPFLRHAGFARACSRTRSLSPAARSPFAHKALRAWFAFQGSLRFCRFAKAEHPRERTASVRLLP